MQSSNQHSHNNLAFIELEDIVSDLEIGILPTEKGRTQRIYIHVIVGFPDFMTRIADTEEALEAKGFDTRVIKKIVTDACINKTALLETIGNAACDKILEIPEALTVWMKITKTYAWADTAKTSLIFSRYK